MKIALVNPPGRYRYLRDYYCANIAKANYSYPPIDFVWISASLDGDVRVYDAIAGKKSMPQMIEEVVSFRPSFIFCLVSRMSIKDDLEFIRAVKKSLNTKLIVMGDICHFDSKNLLLNNLEIDGILRSFDYTNIMDVLNSGLSIDNVPEGWVIRSNGRISEGGEGRNKTNILKIGVPKWDIFQLGKYHFPFAKCKPVATVLIDYGCPFSCSFYPVGTLEWKVRDIDEIVNEINLLVNRGIKEIHFRDQTFGIDRKRTLRLLEHLKLKQISWSCFSRVDLINDEILINMKDAGCHTIIFGIESGSYHIREQYNKNIKDDLIIDILQLCSKIGIKTAGTFIIGLPGERVKDILDTIQFAVSLPLDYASFNIAMPRIGAALGSKCSFLSYKQAEKLAALANRRFYIRFSYLINRLRKIKSFKILLDEGRLGCSLLLR